MKWLVLAMMVLGGCGSWAGNPEDDDDDNDEQKAPPTVIGPGTGGGNLIAGPGDVLLQSVSLRAGVDFRAASDARRIVSQATVHQQNFRLPDS